MTQRDRRNAFLLGIADSSERLRSAGYEQAADLLARMSWLNVAEYHYPDPVVSRLREEPDPHLPAHLAWRVVDEVLECRWGERPWVPFIDAIATPTPARALLWADLYAHPTTKGNDV